MERFLRPLIGLDLRKTDFKPRSSLRDLFKGEVNTYFYVKSQIVDIGFAGSTVFIAVI